MRRLHGRRVCVQGNAWGNTPQPAPILNFVVMDGADELDLDAVAAVFHRRIVAAILSKAA